MKTEIVQGYKVRLIPTPEQEKLMFQAAHTMRFAYNFCINKNSWYYAEHGRSISQNELGKIFTKLRKKYPWLKSVSADIPKQASKDYEQARRKSFKDCGNATQVKFKSRKSTIHSFYNDYMKTKVGYRTVKLTNIGDVRTSTQIKRDERLSNPRVIYDGLHWYITFSLKETREYKSVRNKKVLGVDVGVKELAITSNGDVFENINKSKKMKLLIAKKRKFQKQMSRRYTQGEKVQSRNYYRAKEKHLKVSRKIKNIQDNHLHLTTSTIAKTKHKYVAIEDLNVKGMLKNRRLAKAISNQKFYEFRRQLEYKLPRQGKELLIVSRFFPSSQLCSSCDTKYDNDNQEVKWGLHVREWKCHKCGAEHDRDINAAMNLAKEGRRKYLA